MLREVIREQNAELELLKSKLNNIEMYIKEYENN